MSSLEDRKLLELAAKAAGIEHPAGEHCINGPALWDCKKLSWWRPLTDDGDALRLAVKIRLTIDIVEWGTSCQHWTDASNTSSENCLRHSEHLGDASQATRRAIVCAAAEIGKSMP